MTERLSAWRSDHRHHSHDRLVSEAELESLLSWWRATAKDRAGNPLFCQHFEHTGSCRQCPPPLREVSDE